MHNIIIPGSAGKPILLDAIFKENGKKKPVIIFSHGFKGFKDWGAYNLVAKQFAKEGFVFIKLNYSYNGTTPENPTEFTDLEAFGNNNYTIESDDLGIVIDKTINGEIVPLAEIDTDRLYLIGHSRGGGLSIIKAFQDARVKKVVTWAAVNTLAWGWTPDILAHWKVTGVRYTENKRTGQKMPLNYQFAENYLENEARFNIENALKNMAKPMMALHGTEDEIPVEMAIAMKRWKPDIRLEIMLGANHVFGAKHPYDSEVLPNDLQIAINYTIDFLNS